MAADRTMLGEPQRTKITIVVRADVLACGVCSYCGTFATVVDHIVPVARGGETERWNLTPACQWCNNSKGDRLPEEWRRSRLAAGLPWPPPPFGDPARPRVARQRKIVIDIERALVLYREGYGFQEIANRLNLTCSGATVRARLAESGAVLRTQAEAQAIAKLRRLGSTPPTGDSQDQFSLG